MSAIVANVHIYLMRAIKYVHEIAFGSTILSHRSDNGVILLERMGIIGRLQLIFKNQNSAFRLIDTKLRHVIRTSFIRYLPLV